VAFRFDEHPSGVVPLIDVVVFDLGTGTAMDVGIRKASDLYGVTWASNDTLLITAMTERAPTPNGHRTARQASCCHLSTIGTGQAEPGAPQERGHR
jgi:hypothetical protein